MFLPDGQNRINYIYSSTVITINLTLYIQKLSGNYKLFVLEGPFIGKYHAVLWEDNDEIKLFSFGKGLYYGKISEGSTVDPLFIINKKSIIENELKIQNKYILSCYEKNTSLQFLNKEYDGCMLFNLAYDNGRYIIYIKEGLGILMIRNIKNNRIVEEILVKEA